MCRPTGPFVVCAVFFCTKNTHINVAGPPFFHEIPPNFAPKRLESNEQTIFLLNCPPEKSCQGDFIRFYLDGLDRQRKQLTINKLLLLFHEKKRPAGIAQRLFSIPLSTDLTTADQSFQKLINIASRQALTAHGFPKGYFKSCFQQTA
jgi:hypothetical protein